MSVADDRFALAKSVILAASSLRLFSFMFFKLDVRLINSPHLTAAAYRNNKNKLSIAISRPFIESLNSANELVYVILHEITHILSNHLSRGVLLDGEMYNIAADHVINTNLNFDVNNQRLRGLSIPSGIVIITSLAGKNMSTEEVYEYLMQHATITKATYKLQLEDDSQKGEGESEDGESENKEDGEGEGEPKDGEPKDGKGEGEPKDGKGLSITGTKIHVKLDDGQEFTVYKDFFANAQDIEDLEKELQDDARRILNSPLFEAEKKKGNKSSNTMELIQEAIKVVIPWDQLLENVIKTNITELSENKTWARVNKRMYAYNMILPYNDMEETFDTLMVVVDTSGSISSYDLKKVVDIIKAAMYHFKRVIKVDHDVEVYVKDKIVYDNSTIDNLTKDIRVEFTGRGGTSHKPVYDYLESVYEGDDPTEIIPGLILFITDFCSDIEHIHHSYKWVKEIPYKYIISGPKQDVDPDIDKSPIFIDD